jgi:hypothetical protein
LQTRKEQLAVCFHQTQKILSLDNHPTTQKNHPPTTKPKKQTPNYHQTTKTNNQNKPNSPTPQNTKLFFRQSPLRNFSKTHLPAQKLTTTQKTKREISHSFPPKLQHNCLNNTPQTVRKLAKLLEKQEKLIFYVRFHQKHKKHSL